MTLNVRTASLDDADAITAIYNEGIADRVATLETALRTSAERREWLAERGARYPVIVADTNGEVVGWASLNQFNPRDAYAHVADFSIYVERGWRGQGVGTALLARLIDLARTLGYHKMVLAAFPHNEAGVALYSRAGFTRVGIYHEQGKAGWAVGGRPADGENPVGLDPTSGGTRVARVSRCPCVFEIAATLATIWPSD